METWKPVPGYEDKYEVSDQGRVRSLAKGIMTPKRRNAKYFAVELYLNGIGRFHSIHTLVLTAFVGPCPEGKETCHNNGIGTDNRLVNLRWGTKKDNGQDRVRHGTARTRRTGNYKTKLTPEDVEKIRLDGRVSRLVAQDYGVCSSLIRNIRCGLAK